MCGEEIMVQFSIINNNSFIIIINILRFTIIIIYLGLKFISYYLYNNIVGIFALPHCFRRKLVGVGAFFINTYFNQTAFLAPQINFCFALQKIILHVKLIFTFALPQIL